MPRFPALAQRPRHSQSSTGLTVPEFQTLLTTIEGDWRATRRKRGKRRNRQRKPGGGRKPILPDLADRGYQGVNTDYPDARMAIPIKRARKKRRLTRSEKIRNTKLAKKRIVIEHTFAHLKKFRLLGDVYRNAKERYGDLFKAVAGLVNLRMACRATT